MTPKQSSTSHVDEGFFATTSMTVSSAHVDEGLLITQSTNVDLPVLTHHVNASRQQPYCTMPFNLAPTRETNARRGSMFELVLRIIPHPRMTASRRARLPVIEVAAHRRLMPTSHDSAALRS
jgi:hypothetical protein